MQAEIAHHSDLPLIKVNFMNDNLNERYVILDLESESISIEELESRLLGLMTELEELEGHNTYGELKLQAVEEEIPQDAVIPPVASSNSVSEDGFKGLDSEKAVSDENFAFKLNAFDESEIADNSSEEIGAGESKIEYISDNDLFVAAARLVVEEGVTSVSFLQRRLGIGYGKAVEIVLRLEELAIISPMDGNKPRRVMASPERLEKIISTI